MTQQYNKPIPVPQGESDEYWNKAKEGELWLRSCNDCGNAYFYPRDISPCLLLQEHHVGSGQRQRDAVHLRHSPQGPASRLRPGRALRARHRGAGGRPANAHQHRDRRADAGEPADRHGAQGSLRGHHRHHHAAQVRPRLGAASTEHPAGREVQSPRPAHPHTLFTPAPSDAASPTSFPATTSPKSTPSPKTGRG